MIKGGYILWDVYDSDNNLLKRETGDSLTYTPTQNVNCIPYVMRDKLAIPRGHVVLDSIKVFLRITVTQGANSHWLRDNADGLRFVTTGKTADFFGVYVDNVEIPSNFSYGKYNISSDPVSGGTVLTLLPAFLATLSDGPHTLTFQYNNRENTVRTNFNIGAATPPDVAAPTFNPPAGTYISAQNVTLSCATPGAIIRYTLDGGEPTDTSPVYSGAIPVSSTTTIRAKAFKVGMTASNAVSATYTVAPAPADVPKTGDAAPLALLIGLVLLSGAGLAVNAAVRRRKRAE